MNKMVADATIRIRNPAIALFFESLQEGCALTRFPAALEPTKAIRCLLGLG
jgi:hypothetical protein